MNLKHELEQISQNVGLRHRKIKLKKSEFYSTLLSLYDITEKSSFPEIYHVVFNDLFERPTCAMCNNKVSWDSPSGKYHTYCSSKCSIHIAVSHATSDQSKQRRIETIRDKYSCDNVSELSWVRKSISLKNKEIWKHRNGEYDSEMPYDVLYRRFQWNVAHHTDRTYEKYKHIIDPDGLRGHDYHLDHVYSKWNAFKNDVPMEVLCHYTNLKIIKKEDNLKKNRQNEKTLEQLYEDYSRAMN